MPRFSEKALNHKIKQTMDPNTLFWIVPVASILVLAFAAKFFFDMKKADEGNDRMKGS